MWGLGEAIVQGAVTPDRHVLDKATLGVLTSTVATKEFLLTWDEGKHTTAHVDLANDRRANAPVLTAHELTELGKLARRAEEHYGVPQDLEFAIDGDAIFLTQTRPITTLHEQSAAPSRDKPGRMPSYTDWGRVRARVRRGARARVARGGRGDAER